MARNIVFRGNDEQRKSEKLHEILRSENTRKDCGGNIFLKFASVSLTRKRETFAEDICF